MNWGNKQLGRQDKKEIAFSDRNLVIKISWDHLECVLPQCVLDFCFVLFFPTDTYTIYLWPLIKRRTEISYRHKSPTLYFF